MHLICAKEPVWSGVSTPAVVSWPCHLALSRLPSDVYLSETEVCLGGVYLTPAAHLPRLRKSRRLISGNPPTEWRRVDHRLLMKDGKGGWLGGKRERVNRKIGQGWGHEEAAGELKKKRSRSEGTEEIRLTNILARWCRLMDATKLSWARLRDRTLCTIR